MGKMPVIGLVGACLASVLASGCGEWLTGGTKKDSPPPTFTSKPPATTQTPTGWANTPEKNTAGINGSATGVNTGMPTGNNMPSNTFSGGTPSAGGYNRMGNPSPDGGTPRSGGISTPSSGIPPTIGDGRSTNYSPSQLNPAPYPMTTTTLDTPRAPMKTTDLGDIPPSRTNPTDTFPGAGRGVPPPPLMTTPMTTRAAQTDDVYQKTGSSMPKFPDDPALPGPGTGSSISTPSNKLPPDPISTDPIKSPSTGVSLPTTTPSMPPLPGLPEPAVSQPVKTVPGIPTPPQ